MRIFISVASGVAEALGIFSGNFRGNRQIASRLFGFRQVHSRLGKRQHIGRLVFSAKSQIKRTEFVAVGHQHIHGATQTYRPPRPQQKTFERRGAEPSDSFSEDNQLLPAWILFP